MVCSRIAIHNAIVKLMGLILSESKVVAPEKQCLEMTISSNPSHFTISKFMQKKNLSCSVSLGYRCELQDCFLQISQLFSTKILQTLLKTKIDFKNGKSGAWHLLEIMNIEQSNNRAVSYYLMNPDCSNLLCISMHVRRLPRDMMTNISYKL